MSVRWTRVADKSGKRREYFELKVDAHALTVDAGDKNHLKLNVAAVAHDKQGNIAGDMTQAVDAHLDANNLNNMLAGGLRYTNAIELPPGEFNVKFIVRDALSGRMGTVTAPVSVEGPPVAAKP